MERCKEIEMEKGHRERERGRERDKQRTKGCWKGLRRKSVCVCDIEEHRND